MIVVVCVLMVFSFDSLDKNLYVLASIVDAVST
jgi:hypothetical protein